MDLLAVQGTLQVFSNTESLVPLRTAQGHPEPRTISNHKMMFFFLPFHLNSLLPALCPPTPHLL